MLKRAGVLVAAATAVVAQDDVGQLCSGYDSCFDCAAAVTNEDYVKFKYYACYDQLNIVPDNIECIPFSTDNMTYPKETLQAGEYRHYHWTLTTYTLINDEAGASITFEVIPEVGYPQMFTKAQILYGGMPMCQMFETQPGTEGTHSSTWPFPDKNTGAEAQGPEEEIANLERNNTAGTYTYPGAVFSEVTWGFNASGYDSDKRPKVHTVTIPHVSYGGYFVSVYAGDNHNATYSISIRAERTIDIVEEEEEYATEHMPAAVKETASWWIEDAEDGSSSYCSAHTDASECERHCCTWDDGTDDDVRRRRMSEVGKPAFQRGLQDASVAGECVQASIDVICVSEKESEDGTNTIPEPTILVSFQTGSDANDKYSLYYVELNDCASQMDRNGHEFCWEKGWYTDGGRLADLLADGGKFIDPNWQETCGKASGEVDADGIPICDPTMTDPGYCNFDGSGSYLGTPAETMWARAYDCIVWTPNGLARHGLPVEYTQYQSKPDADGVSEWLSIEDNWDGNVEGLYDFDYDNSLRLKGIVTSYDKDIWTYYHDLGTEDPDYRAQPYDGWLTLPTNTWITTEIAVYNNVSYFFNVLKEESGGELDCYKGTSARTQFWRQTTLIPVEMIEIIAVVVVLALLALLVPFILTKRKITAHLRDVYESHKYKGYLKGVEERVIEERARRNDHLNQNDNDNDAANDEDVALQKEEANDEGGNKHKKKKHHKKKHGHGHGHHHHGGSDAGGADSKEESKEEPKISATDNAVL